MDVDFSENLEIKSENEKLPPDCHELSSSKVAPIDLAVRLSELYPAVNQRSTPIPTRWADNEDCFQHLSLKNGKTRVEYKGKGQTHKDAAAVRTQHPIPKTCGVYYYEVKIISKGRDGFIGMGLSDYKVKLNRLPGWDENSYGYHGDDGNIFAASGSGQAYGPTFTTGDVIGCCFNLAEKQIFFTKNGENLDIAFKGVTSTTLFPTLGMQTPGEIVQANFGQSEFIFDFDKYLHDWRSSHREYIETFPVDNLNGNHEDTLKNIIFDYLKHQGFKESASKFAAALKLQEEETQLDDENDDSETRLELTNLILDGRITETIDLVNLHYPSLLEEDKEIDFYLKFRQFIELIAGTEGEMKNFQQPKEKSKETICGGSVTAIEDMIMKGRNLNEIIESTENKDQKHNLMQLASTLLIENDPLNGQNSQWFSPEYRERTAQMLSVSILRHSKKKTASSLSYIINQSNYIHNRLVSREIPQAAFLRPDIYLNET
jgi:hypothetical protein